LGSAPYRCHTVAMGVSVLYRRENPKLIESHDSPTR
jgi:hypothetical protein